MRPLSLLNWSQLCFHCREAKKDPVGRQAYRLLTSIHESFEQISEKILATDRIRREVTEREKKLTAMALRSLNVDKLQADLEAIRRENEYLEKSFRDKVNQWISHFLVTSDYNTFFPCPIWNILVVILSHILDLYTVKLVNSVTSYRNEILKIDLYLFFHPLCTCSSLLMISNINLI